jgi:hypothetical protein
MPNDWDPRTARRSLTVAVIVFAAAFRLHRIDHLRRGMAASPPSIMVGGMIQGIFVVVAVVLILRHHRWASWAAIVVGFGSAVVFVYAHLLPTFSRAFKTASFLDHGSTSDGSLGLRPSLRSGLAWCSATWTCKHGDPQLWTYPPRAAAKHFVHYQPADTTNHLARQGNNECCTLANTSA